MVKRIVRFEAADGAYKLIYESLAVFRPGPQKEDIAEAALRKLGAIGVPDEPAANRDLLLLKLEDAGEVELLESERDLLLDAIAAVPWPTFALAKKRHAVDLLRNAEAQPVS